MSPTSNGASTRKLRRRLLLPAVAVVLVFLAVTLIALEGKEVVVLGTQDADRTRRATRTWIAAEDGSLWIEAANPERPFLMDIATRPDVELRHGNATQKCRAYIELNPQGHLRIRRLLAAKYGWADSWVGLLTDTSGSLAVRLQCEQSE